MGQEKKPGNSGAAKAYITRRKAIGKLQLSLKDFRRICIMKGVYPVDPKHKKKIGTGSQNKTYYLLSDILYLSHEPIIWKFWEFKIFMKRLTRASGRRDFDNIEHIKENRPFYKLDHIVKERYPSFTDAIRDLDDALSMCFLFSRFPKSKALPIELVNLSRRLTVEFMHYIIESKALRKVFISIKGYYYQAEIMGQLVTWVVPHEFVLTRASDVDYKVMKTFTEFYVTLMGFVNFKLFTSLNLYYPPKTTQVANKTQLALLSGEDEIDLEGEFISALSRPLLKSGESGEGDAESKPDDFEEVVPIEGEEEIKSCVGFTFSQTLKLQRMFEGLKFFINREVPRESLVFIIRSFGGQVSWDINSFVGAAYDENDPKITHHIVDRDVVSKKRLDRSYIQPQWVFDCVNARTLLKVQDYFPGVPLPAHLSPFVEEGEGDYISPETLRLRNLQSGNVENVDKNTVASSDANESKPAGQEAIKNKKRNIEELKTEVRPSKLIREDVSKQAKVSAIEEKKLAEMMIPKKKKRLYDKIMFGKKRKAREVENLKNKRSAIEKKKSST